MLQIQLSPLSALPGPQSLCRCPPNTLDPPSACSGGTAGNATSTPFTVLRVCLPPGYRQGLGRQPQAEVPSSSASTLLLTYFHP